MSRLGKLKQRNQNCPQHQCSAEGLKYVYFVAGKLLIAGTIMILTLSWSMILYTGLVKVTMISFMKDTYEGKYVFM